MKKLLFHPISAIILTIVSLSVISSLRSHHQSLQSQQQLLLARKQEISQLETQLQQQQQQIEQASYAITKERMIRDELLMQKEGELIVQIPNFEPSNVEITPTPTKIPMVEWQQLLSNHPVNHSSDSDN